jgi:hypothetical protein
MDKGAGLGACEIHLVPPKVDERLVRVSFERKSSGSGALAEHMF